MNRLIVIIGCCLFVSRVVPAAEPGGAVIFNMESVRHKPTEVTLPDKRKVPCGTAKLVEGHEGKAVKFAFIENARGGFFTASVRATPEWDQADGFSFWVKGDESNSFGGIELIDKSDFSKRYGYCFAIDSTGWRKVVVPWRDLTPELAGPLVDAKNGYAPSNFGNFWFGKWFYYRDFPAHSFTIDQVTLERHIEIGPIPKVEPGLTRLRAKLEAHKPITIVTMGDSLSDTHHWSNRTVVWSQLLARDLKAKYGGEVTIVNPAIGGTTLNQNLVLIPRWLKDAPKPDLVTIWFGGNDWDNNVRGERFAEYLRLAVDRIRRQTGGSADILLMTTAPTHDRWETYRELEEAAQAVAKEKGTGLAETAAELRKPGDVDRALKETIWAWDKVHLGAKGHEAAKEAVIRAIAGTE